MTIATTTWVSSLLVSLGVTIGMTWLILKTEALHRRLSHDHDTSSAHKYHIRPVSRIGGMALLIGLGAGGAYHGLQGDGTLYLSKWAGIAVLPVFIGGFFEDIFKSVTPRDRLLLAFLSAAIAYYQFGIGLNSIDWLWFDEYVLAYPGVSLLLTVVMIGGVCHATNIIDGFNGLLLGITMMAIGVFATVAWNVGADLLLIYMGIMFGAVLGLFLFNYPWGRIFTGDGGAYLLGFLLATLSLFLVSGHASVSPWFPLVVLAYPVFEVVFSVTRKKLVGRRPVSEPDQMHLHMLVHRALLIRKLGVTPKVANPLTSPVLWLVAALSMFPALLWWNNTRALVLILCLWCLGYVGLYLYLANLDRKAES